MPKARRHDVWGAKMEWYPSVVPKKIKHRHKGEDDRVDESLSRVKSKFLR